MITVPRWAIFVVGMYAGAALLKLFFNRQRSRGKRATGQPGSGQELAMSNFAMPSRSRITLAP
jgi:hypothetical protein